MPLHTDLPIYKKGCELVTLAFNVQSQMPRSFKRTLGEKITVHCTFAAGNSYLGLLRQASHSHADRAHLANVLRDRGHAVKSDFSKIYRRKP